MRKLLTYLFFLLIGIGNPIYGNTSLQADLDNSSLSGKVFGGSLLSTNGVYSNQGLYSFSVTNGDISISQRLAGADFFVTDGILLNGDYHTTRMFTIDGEMGTQGYLNSWDIMTWQNKSYTLIGSRYYVYYLAYDIGKDLIYGIDMYNQLVTMKYDKGSTSNNNEVPSVPISLNTIGTFSVQTIIGFSSDEQGNYYIMVRNSDSEVAELYRVDIENVTVEFIGSTGLKVLNTYSSFFYDWESGKFYWTANQSSSSGLYEVNVLDGSVSLALSFPNREQFAGLFIKDVTSDLAPSDVDVMSFSSSNGSLDGTINFLVPSTLQDGSSLTGSVTAKVYLGSELIDEISLQARDIYEKQVSFDHSGQQVLRVILSNSAGNSKTSVYGFWVGDDSPSSVTNLVADYNSDGNVVVSWSGVTSGAHSGYVDASSVRYRLVRLPDNVELASSLSKTDYLDESVKSLSAPFQAYKYKVIPYIGDLIGESEVSNQILAGAPLVLPYGHNFADNNDLSLWTIIDANNDGQTWKYNRNSGDDDGYMGTPGSVSNASNDWLITPLLNLEPGGAYKITFSYKNTSGASPKVRVTYGSSLQFSSHKEIKSFTDLSASTKTLEEIAFSLPTDETEGCYIGFQAYTERGVAGGAMIHDINVTLAANSGSPNVVTDLSINYTDAGQSPAVLSFVSPKLTASNGNLGSLTRIEIYRNDSEAPVHVMSGVSPGVSYSWIDSDVSSGINYYSIVGVNARGSGLVARDSVYIGLDVPCGVGNLTLSRAADGNALLSWDAPIEGIHKGYIKDCVYRIVRSDNRVVSSSYSGTSYTDDVSKTDQQLYSYTVLPFYSDVSNSYGGSVSSGVVRFGSAYAAPYAESFASGSYGLPGWSSSVLSGSVDGWQLSRRLAGTTFSAQDDDNGMAICYVDDVMTLGLFTSPLLDLSTVDSPVLRFWFTHYEYPFSDECYMTVKISTDGGETFEALSDRIHVVPDRNEGNITVGWNLHEFSLEAYKGMTNVMLGFESVQGLFGFAIDNITISEQPDYDLKVLNFELPSRLLAGTSSNNFSVLIKNSGKQSASGYTINLYKGDDVISSLSGERLSPDESRVFVLPASFASGDAGKSYSFRVEIDYAPDELDYDNVSKVISGLVERGIYSSVVLEGADEDGSILLEWIAPSFAKVPVLIEESFEEYEAFIIDGIGDWTVRDEDGQNTLVMGNIYFNLWNYPHVGEPMAYQVFNSKLISAKYNSWDGHTGTQALACFVQVGNIDANDDWLISPELNGSSQDVSFYARTANPGTTNPERFIFYYSEDGMELSDFVQLTAGSFQEVPSDWTQYRYTLPEGARYFAIRCVSENTITFLVDDIFFARGGADAVVLGYNVYRNDVKLNDSPLASTRFSGGFVSSDERNVYTVTAVYEGGESNYSNSIVIDYTDISDTSVDPIGVYGLVGGLRIEGGFGLLVDVFSIDGSLVYRGVCSSDEFISLSAGVYIVKVGEKVAKVIVK